MAKVSTRPDEVVEAQFKGEHGKGHHRALVPGVGLVFYNQIVQMKRSEFDKLGDEWVEVTNSCRMIGQDGNRCPRPRAEGSDYCQGCTNLINESVVNRGT